MARSRGYYRNPMELLSRSPQLELTAVDKDRFIRAYHENAGSWVGLVSVYAVLVAGMAFFGSVIL